MIILKKSGIFFDNELNPESEEYIYKEVGSIIPYLNESLQIEENFTLRDFFSVIEDESEKIEFIFSSYLGNYSLPPYLREIKQDCMPEHREEMDYIECSWVAEQFDYALFYKYSKRKH